MSRRRKIVLVLVAVLAVVTVVNLTWARLPAEPPLPAGSKFALVDGKRIHYVEHAGREPAVVMIHGLPGTWGDWDAVAARLKDRRTIQIDRPGYAFSQEGYVPFREQVELIQALVQKLGLHAPVIAGHSYGGAIALQYALQYGHNASGIVAVDPAVSARDVAFKTRMQARMIQLMRLPVVRQVGSLTVFNIVRRVSLAVGGNEAFDPEARDPGWYDRALALSARYRDLGAYSSEVIHLREALATLGRRLPQIGVPVQVVQGSGDRLVRTRSVKRAAAQAAMLELTVLPGGHMQTYTHPEAVAAAVRAAGR